MPAKRKSTRKATPKKLHLVAPSGAGRRRSTVKKSGGFAPWLIPLGLELAKPIAKMIGEKVVSIAHGKNVFTGRGLVRAGSSRMSGGTKKKH